MNRSPSVKKMEFINMKYFNVKRTWGVETIDDIDINDLKQEELILKKLEIDLSVTVLSVKMSIYLQDVLKTGETDDKKKCNKRLFIFTLSFQ